MQKPHFPNCGHRHDYVESRDQSMSRVLRSKHIGRHHEQKLPYETTEQNDDTEYEQILLTAQLQAMKLGHQQIVKSRLNLQPLQLGDLRQGSARDDLL
jgi:hypothetical protein